MMYLILWFYKYTSLQQQKEKKQCISQKQRKKFGKKSKHIYQNISYKFGLKKKTCLPNNLVIFSRLLLFQQLRDLLNNL